LCESVNADTILCMKSESISRRKFLAASGALLAARGAYGQKTLPTAGNVLERMKDNVGVPWLSDTMKATVDNLLGGDASTPVRGIATTTMATIDVMRMAVAKGLNMIVSHETPFYLHLDKIDDLKDDTVLGYKLDYMRENKIVVLHWHDHWHHRTPDGSAYGMMKEVGWEKYSDSPDKKHFMLPPQPLAKFAKNLEQKLQLHNVRVIGKPEMQVSRVYTSWGFASRQVVISILNRPDVDTLVTGESVEWEGIPYVQDMVAMGQKKALVLLGHVNSENGGMRYCAEWLRSFIHEVPIGFIPAPEPFWPPDHPIG
jgi:putative NIF3 family GTP cyclohydrolase 1 type 2